MPQPAVVVIVGDGIIECSIAYHLSLARFLPWVAAPRAVPCGLRFRVDSFVTVTEPHLLPQK